MANRSLILLFLIIVLAIPLAGADLPAPSIWHYGFKLWGNFLDMWGENGVRNGTIGGVNNNVTFLDSNGVQFLSRSGTTVDLDMNNKNITNVRIINSTEVNVTTFNATSISGNGSGIFSLNGDNITGAPVLRNTNGSLLLKEKVDVCTGASQAIGYNESGFPCRTISSSVQNNQSQINTSRGNMVLDTTNYTVLVDAGASGYNVTLPAASQNSGRIYNIKRVDNSSSNSVLVNTTGTEKIDTADTYNLTWQGQHVTLQANGSQWWIVDEAAPTYIRYSEPQEITTTSVGFVRIYGVGVTGKIRGTYNISTLIGSTAGSTAFMQVRVNGNIVGTNVTNNENGCCVMRMIQLPIIASVRVNSIELWGGIQAGQTATFREFNISTVI